MEKTSYTHIFSVIFYFETLIFH